MPAPLTLDEPLSIQALLDGAMRQTRLHFRAIFPAVGVPLAVLGATLPLAQGVWFRSMGGLKNSAPNLGILFAGAGATLLVTFLFVVLSVVGYATLIAAATDVVAGRPISMQRAWLVVVRPYSLITLFLSGLAVFGGVLCCVFPGIYISLLFTMIVPVMVEEGTTLVDGLSRSASLAQYNPRRELADDPRVRAFLLVFVGMLIEYAVSFVIQLPLAVIQNVILMRQVVGGQATDPMALMASLTWLQVPTIALATLGRVAVQLYVSFGIALLYFDVRRRREGHDLGAAVARLQQRGPAADSPL